MASYGEDGEEWQGGQAEAGWRESANRAVYTRAALSASTLQTAFLAASMEQCNVGVWLVCLVNFWCSQAIAPREPSSKTQQLAFPANRGKSGER